MRMYVFLAGIMILIAGLAAQSPPGRESAPFGRPAPVAPAPQIDGPDTVAPFHLGRYRVRQEWPFYEWRVEPSADADVQPIGNGNVVDIVARPGKYTITLTVGGRRGKSQDITRVVEFMGEVPPVVSPPDPVVSPPDPGVNPPPVPAVPSTTQGLY